VFEVRPGFRPECVRLLPHRSEDNGSVRTGSGAAMVVHPMTFQIETRVVEGRVPSDRLDRRTRRFCRTALL
jgi:hypothetical protein